MHLMVSQKSFCLYCVCIVYAVAMTSHENRSSSFQTFLHFLKVHHKIFNSSKFVNVFLCGGGLYLAHSKNINCVGRSARIWRGDGWKYGDTVGKMSIFYKALSISLYFCGW